jgi:hypothetical protein
MAFKDRGTSQPHPFAFDAVWRVSASGAYPDRVLTPGDRDDMLTEASARFAGWVIEGRTYELRNRSGGLAPTKTTAQQRLALYTTLGEWMEDAFTGSFHETFSDDIDRRIIDVVWDLWTQGLTEAEREHMVDVDAWDDAVECEYALRECVAATPTADAWQRGEDIARRAIAETHAEQARQQELTARHREHARQFWQRTFHDLPPDIPMTMNSPCVRMFLNRLQHALSGAAREEVHAIAQVGLPGNFSNKVENLIWLSAQEALHQRQSHSAPEMSQG